MIYLYSFNLHFPYYGWTFLVFESHFYLFLVSFCYRIVNDLLIFRSTLLSIVIFCFDINDIFPLICCYIFFYLKHFCLGVFYWIFYLINKPGNKEPLMRNQNICCDHAILGVHLILLNLFLWILTFR